MVFCLFGFLGFCADVVHRRASQRMQTTAISEFVVEKVMSEMQDMKARAGASQEISCVIEKSGNCSITNIDMKQMTAVTTEGRANLQKALTSEATLNRVIDKAASAALDYVNKVSGGNRFTFTETEQELITYTKTQFRDVMRSSTIVNCIADSIASQVVRAQTRRGNVTIDAINMTQTTTVLADCLVNSIFTAASRIENREDLSKRIREETKIYHGNILYTLLLVGGGLIAMIILGFYLTRRSSAPQTQVVQPVQPIQKPIQPQQIPVQTIQRPVRKKKLINSIKSKNTAKID